MGRNNSEFEGNGTKKRAKVVISVLVGVFLLFSAAGTAMGFMSYSKYLNMLAVVNEPNIYQNIRINGVDVGGLNKTEALQKVMNTFLPPLNDKKISLHGGGKEFIYRYEEFNVKLEFAQAIEEAYAYGREEASGIDARYKKITALETTPYEITYEPPYSFDTSAAQDKAGVLADQVYVAPVDATINRVGGQFVTTKEASGAKMDVKTTAAKMNELLAAQREGDIDIALTDIAPKYTEEDVKKAESLIGTFSTSIPGGTAGRSSNIATAAEKINETTLMPGETFSANVALGPTTPENGYSLAGVIVNGKLEQDYGGGVCQVSTTLYNAVLYAELDVVERFNHSLRVTYVGPSYDATLAGDYKDLKFMNSTELPVFLECYVQNGRVIANIYGQEIHDSGHSLEFYNKLLETVPTGREEVIYDSSLPKGERVVTKTGSAGSRYALYKITYEDGQEVGRDQVNSSYYTGSPSQVRVGTGAAKSSQPKENRSQSAGNRAAQNTPKPAEKPAPQPEPSNPDPVAEPLPPSETYNPEQ